jgi:hypothetical protein
LSLGESLVYVLNILLPIEEYLSILHGDTLFKSLNLNKSRDILEISRVDSNYDWTYIMNENQPLFNTKNIKSIQNINDCIVSGYFNFSEPYILIKSLIQSKYSFIKALKLYSEEKAFFLNLNEEWMDFGLSSTYFHSRKNFTTERTFNSLNILDGYVKKCSEKKGKLNAEMEWFESFPSELDLFLPRFKLDENDCYKTEYLYFTTLNELFVFGALPANIWKQIFVSIQDFLNKLHAYKIQDNVNFEYKEKTLERVKEFLNQKSLNLEHIWKFNGKELPSIKEIIEELDSYLICTEEKYSFIHGDMCFSNIMYDFKSNSIKVFDPRGMDFNGKITQGGKCEYDYAKLMHSVIGMYDFIISDFYELDYSKKYNLDFELCISQRTEEIQKIFLKIFDEINLKKVFAIMVHLFFSMLPLHSDDEKRQFALLANAFRLYQELERIE